MSVILSYIIIRQYSVHLMKNISVLFWKGKKKTKQHQLTITKKTPDVLLYYLIFAMIIIVINLKTFVNKKVMGEKKKYCKLCATLRLFTRKSDETVML